MTSRVRVRRQRFQRGWQVRRHQFVDGPRRTVGATLVVFAGRWLFEWDYRVSRMTEEVE